MSDRDEDVKRWIEIWREAGSTLEAQRRRDLEALTDDDVRRAVADLFSMSLPEDLPPRTGSGLVEQQRLFARLRQRP